MMEIENARALVVLGGSIWPGPNGDKWQTNGLDAPGDAFGLTLDRFRVIAASLLARDGGIVIASGGEATDAQPSIASVIEEELIALGVADWQVVKEEKSASTYQQLVALKEIIREHALTCVRFISNEWHLSRIRAMVECAPGLEHLACIIVEYVPAEATLLERDTLEWGATITVMRADPRLPSRLALEARGEAQIRAGTYKFK